MDAIEKYRQAIKAVQGSVVYDGYFADPAKVAELKSFESRINACVRACEGIEDPEGAIERCREAMAKAMWSDISTELYLQIESALAALTPKETTSAKDASHHGPTATTAEEETA